MTTACPVFAAAMVLSAALVAGFVAPPPLPLPVPLPLPLPLPLPATPAAEPRPQKHFPGSVCPTDTTCVRPQDCSRQCRPGWESFGLSSCYLLGPATAMAQSGAEDYCAGHGGHLPVIEDAEELARMAELSPQWTNASWDGDGAVWVWGASGQPVDFTALAVPQPADGSTAAACLLLRSVAGGPPEFVPTACQQTALFSCETGSQSVARCARKKERLCCAVGANHYGEPCYVDEQGTRCEQRIREGYFPLGEGLVRPTEGTGQLSWEEARELCRADGGDLLTVDDRQMNQKILDMLTGLAALGATEFYIGLSSDADGAFSYVNGTAAVAGSSYLNFATAEDASRPSSCVFYSGMAWSSGVCTVPRDFICHIRRVRHSLRQEPEVPQCGVRQRQGVLGKSGRSFLPPRPLPPPPPLVGATADGRRTATQFGEITWQAAVWTRSTQTDHEFSCSGALVHPAWVLTSAECVSGAQPADLKVTVGDWDLDETEPVSLPPVALDVTRVRTSPGRVSHGPYGPVLESGRLAMLRITPELDGDEYPHIGPVCLPDASFLQHINQLSCVVTGWRGGAQPAHQPWRPQPKPDLRDILRKFETGVRHDPECQDVAHHLRQLRQRPPYHPPFPVLPYPPFPVPYSAEGLEARSQFGFGPPPFFGPPLAPPPPPAADQPALYICPRDPRCIADSGALLACALPPPPPPPPHFQPRPPPPPLPLPPFYRSAQNDTAEAPAAPASAPAPAATSPVGPADAYEQLSKSFRPPIDKKVTVKRARRSSDADGAASTPAAGAAPAPAAPAAAPAPTARGEEQKDPAGDVDGRSAFNLPHNIIGAFHAVPPPPLPSVVVHHRHELEVDLDPGLAVQPPPGAPTESASTRHYDAYVLVGIASSLNDGCALGRMVFDDVIQEVEFVQQVLHRGG